LHLPGIGPGNEVAMSSGKPAEKFDTIIIGTGQSGKPLALALGRAGRKTAVVERKHVGGTCINVGCTPTKTMVASARVAYLARRGADFGVHTSAPRVDLAEVWRRKQGVVEQFRGGGQRGLESVSAIDLMFGEGSFVDAHTVRVALNDGGERHLTADRVVINTGGRPAVPAIPGLKEVDWLDSSSIMELQVLPPHLVVLGGGYIGLEFSQMFRRFGARVTVITRDDRLIPREDPDVSAEVEKILVEDGIGIVKNANTLRAAGRGGVTVTVDTPEGRSEIGGSHLLVAIGRAPNSDRLNLQAAGIAADKAGFIPVNNRLETAVPGIYAIGDVKGGPAFTHISYDDYRVLRANWLEGGNATIDGRYVPNTMFIDPQLATVGLNETEAKKRGLNYRVAKLAMTSVARAIEMGETRGFMKAIVDADTRSILGCTVLGVEGGEIMSMLQIAMMGKLPYPALREAIFAHPTLAESLNNLFGTVD
jgi:pyruvate/2-oxoglutarate dehydrogenase complex dihydrolipoamide dehydrogenase (E3) component